MSEQSLITKDMTIADIVALCPDSEKILAEYGLHCVGCAANGLETLAEGCMGHGFSEEDVTALLTDVNEAMNNMSAPSQELTVTQAAAEAIRGIAESEGKLNEGLLVTVDGGGGFCMEFQPEPSDGDAIFFHPDVPETRIFASAMTLRRIGGSTIDFRDERFKLDLPEVAHGSCACGGSCNCKKH